VLSQTQPPAVQCWPTGHCAPALQRHWPPEQPFARTGSHAVHAAPPEPHCAALIAVVTQLEPLQQPLEQVAGLQPVHAWPAQVPGEHEAHVAPPVPHSAVVLPALHWLPAQHPLGQLWALHTHAAPEHAWLAMQAEPRPHLQVPVSQRSERPSHAAHAAPEAPQLAVLCEA
jgi:hypothetical protein